MVSPVDKAIDPLISEVPESTSFIVIDSDSIVDGTVPEVIVMLHPVPELPFPPMGGTDPPVTIPATLLKVNAPPLSTVLESHLIDVLPLSIADESSAVKDTTLMYAFEEETPIKVIEPPVLVSADPTPMTTLSPVPDTVIPVSRVKMPL